MAWTLTRQSVLLSGTKEWFEVTKVLIRGRKWNEGQYND
jgi:hypothetical protein